MAGGRGRPIEHRGRAIEAWRGRRLHHVIDPRTARPADGPWRTASVAAATCLDANAAATAAIVLGRGAERWLAERGLPARLVSHDGSIATVGQWPAPATEAAPWVR